jgi:chemotaxis protein methyltransferase WspC
MNQPIGDLRALLRASTGLAPSDADLERAIRDADVPRPGTPEFDTLLDRVVVPESWMLRDRAVFDEALRFVQRRLAARPARPVRILSLPCAGGEEPYSMALVLAEAGIPATRCRIDAVDLSQAAIARARSGRFTRNAFRGADLAFRERWFTRCDDSAEEYLIDAALRAYVGFRQGNLLAPDACAGEPAYDLVFCRNLLIYFDDATQARAAHAIGALLADDGVLLSGHAEAPSFCRHGFAPTRHAGFALHKRGVAAQPAQQPAQRAAGAPPRKLVPPLPAPLPATAAPAPAQRRLQAQPRPQPQPQDLLAQAQDHADHGRLADAEAACRACLTLVPDSAAAWFLLGMIHELGGHKHAADASWRRCVYLAPDHYEALCSLALLHEGLGDAATGAGFRQRAARIFARRGSAQA